MQFRLPNFYVSSDPVHMYMYNEAALLAPTATWIGSKKKSSTCNSQPVPRIYCLCMHKGIILIEGILMYGNISMTKWCLKNNFYL